MPNPNHQNPIPGADDIARRALDNGIVVLARENFTAQSVVVTGILHAGALFDPPELAGRAAFTAGTLLYGTATRDFDTLHETLDSLGAELSISSGGHTVGFGGKSLAEDLPTLLDILQEALRAPTFPAEHVERLRGQIMTALNIRQHDTRYRAGRAFRELAYPAAHPYHHPTGGKPESIPAITLSMLRDFHQAHYGPRGMIIVVVGAVEAEAALDAVQAIFADWQHPDQPEVPALPAVPAITDVRQQVIVVPGKTQTDIVLGVPGPGRGDPHFHAARMANSILGSFGMMGRLGEVVREQQGLAYYSYSSVQGEAGSGPWSVSAGVNPANVERAIDSIRGEIRRLTTEPVSDEDLADNKTYFTGRLPLQLEGNEGVAAAILRMERYGLGLDYLRGYPALIHALTKDDLLAAARHYLNPDAYALAVAGPGGAGA